MLNNHRKTTINLPTTGKNTNNSIALGSSQSMNERAKQPKSKPSSEMQTPILKEALVKPLSHKSPQLALLKSNKFQRNLSDTKNSDIASNLRVLDEIQQKARKAQLSCLVSP